MKTIASHAPGFFAARTNQSDKSIPEGKIQIAVARIEIYELDGNEQRDMDTTFLILAAKAENDPRMARALLDLEAHLTSNHQQILSYARKA